MHYGSIFSACLTNLENPNKAMSDVINQARIIRKKLWDFQHYQKLQHRLEGFKERKEIFAGYVSQLRAINTIREALTEQGVSLEPREDGKELIPVIREWMEYLASEQAERWVHPESRAELSDLERRIEWAIQKRQEQTRRDWEAFVQKHTPQISEEVLRILEKLPHIQDDVKRLHRKIQRMRELASQLPKDTESIDEVRYLAEEMRALWNRFEGIPEAVVAFLKDVTSSQGASLSRLTEDVWQWVREHGLEDNFRIYITKSAWRSILR